MSEALRLRRHLYEHLAGTRVASRRRRGLRRQIALVAPGGPPEGGAAGVREPRRPVPGAGPTGRALPPA